MDWIEEFLKDPDHLAALGYGAATLTVSAYTAYRNDFGAPDKTTRELEEYLEEADTGVGNPVQTWKAYEYRKEFEERRMDRQPDLIDDEIIYDDIREESVSSDD